MSSTNAVRITLCRFFQILKLLIMQPYRYPIYALSLMFFAVYVLRDFSATLVKIDRFYIEYLSIPISGGILLIGGLYTMMTPTLKKNGYIVLALICALGSSVLVHLRLKPFDEGSHQLFSTLVLLLLVFVCITFIRSNDAAKDTKRSVTRLLSLMISLFGIVVLLHVFSGYLMSFVRGNNSDSIFTIGLVMWMGLFVALYWCNDEHGLLLALLSSGGLVAIAMLGLFFLADFTYDHHR